MPNASILNPNAHPTGHGLIVVGSRAQADAAIERAIESAAFPRCSVLKVHVPAPGTVRSLLRSICQLTGFRTNINKPLSRMTEHVLAVLRNEEIRILHVDGLEPEAASQSHIETDHCYELLCVVMRRGVNVIVNAPHVPSPLTRSAGLRRYFHFLTACDVAAGEAQHVFRRMRVDR